MTDIVRIAGVSAQGCHGVLPEERTYLQQFIADIESEVSTRRAAELDEVGDTVSYADLAADAVAVITGESVNLIETLAERIAARVLARGVRRVRVSIHKPDAPVGLPFTDAAVTIERDGVLCDRGSIRRAVLALGSNVGDREAHLRFAIEAIGALPLAVAAVADCVETTALTLPGQGEQPDFLNTVVLVDTALSPLELLRAVQEIEVRGGRVRHERWGARTLDIDIVDFAGVESSDPELLLPHPGAAERLFVLEPWAQVEPDAELAGVRVADILAELTAVS